MRPANLRAHPQASDTAAAADRFADDVRASLGRSPKQIPSRYLYDPLGSALFDAICHLPWYRLTASETQLLARHGSAILGALGPLARIVELGSGNGSKLVTLLASRPRAVTPLGVHLVDVSGAALVAATRALGVFDDVRVTAHEASYESGLDAVMPALAGAGRTLALFLGSNIGNYDPADSTALLGHVRSVLRPGDGLLLGADLVKPEPELLQAYDDPLGVTAAFNRNLLVRMNRELDADFDLEGFAHRAAWNSAASRVEMHLVSLRAQQVRIPRAGIVVSLERGEYIWTESSYKYEPAGVVERLESVGFARREQWIDAAARFALTLVEVPGARAGAGTRPA